MKGFIPFGGSVPTAKTLDARELKAVFSEPISVYTTQQAIEDGVLFDAGALFRRRIIFTSNLLAKAEEKAALLALTVKGLASAAHFGEPDLVVFELGGIKAYVQDNGTELTFMLPEDY